jgi:hypothetical protein
VRAILEQFLRCSANFGGLSGVPQPHPISNSSDQYLVLPFQRRNRRLLGTFQFILESHKRYSVRKLQIASKDSILCSCQPLFVSLPFHSIPSQRGHVARWVKKRPYLMEKADRFPKLDLVLRPNGQMSATFRSLDRCDYVLRGIVPCL